MDLQHTVSLNTSYVAALFLAVSFLAFSCGSTEEKPLPASSDTEAGHTAEDHEQTTREIFYHVPSPVESASLLERAGAEYDPTLLHDIREVGKYVTMTKKAKNLGIYTTDLAYAGIFEQSSDVIFYSASTQKLSNELSITEAYTEETVERIESNVADKDSILRIISEAYYKTDAQLRENQRASLSALILAGGCVEGLYIASSLALANPENEELQLRLLEQKYSLANLILLASKYEEENIIKPVLADLRELHSLFDDVEHTETAESTLSTNPETQVTVINTGRTLAAEAETIARLHKRVKEIRNGYTQP